MQLVKSVKVITEFTQTFYFPQEVKGHKIFHKVFTGGGLFVLHAVLC